MPPTDQSVQSALAHRPKCAHSVAARTPHGPTAQRVRGVVPVDGESEVGGGRERVLIDQLGDIGN